ncbi:Lrp/AsnC family transcriptional regulator [Gracilimonas amylolytica]|uniref:Lrp/AsnC family transcriptional regulator n=1 Tax=Gracilimonas amylolytica TaxID=1749045 RepID=UPI000CD9234C|nr:Lrp/AsnC family transcriptional regulator [Gracilimonas amylolytica]
MALLKLDQTDKQIIQILQQEGRIANNELAKRIGLTTTPTLERVRRLEREGVIDGYAAKVNKDSVGRGFTAFVKVTLKVHQLNLMEEFTAAIRDIPEILACYHTTGDGDFLLHVVAKDTKDYEQLMRNKLTTLPDVERLHTSIVLNTIKDQSPIPVHHED